MYHWNGIEHFGAMSLWWIIGIVLIVALVWAVARPTGRNDPDGGPSAEEILKRRYARGEIDKDQYESRLQDIRR